MCSGCFGDYEDDEDFGRHLSEERAAEREPDRGAFSPPAQGFAADRLELLLRRSDDFEILVSCDTIVEIRRIYDQGAAPAAAADAMVPSLVPRVVVDAPGRIRGSLNDRQTAAWSAKNYRTSPRSHGGREIVRKSAGHRLPGTGLWLVGMSLLAMTALALWLLAG